ncbi:MAG: multiheme c-type cytochrome [Thermodesulfobacteriota bacterium]
MRAPHLVLCVSALLLAWSQPLTSAASEQFPFFPSLLNTATGKPVLSTDFFPPQRCRGCHAEIFDQWKGSMHSNAFHDPVFQALWRLGSDETGGAVDKLCAGCHTGVGTVAEEVVRDANGHFQVSEIAAEGVQCHFCHSVVSSNMLQTPTNMPQNASIVVDPGLVMRGPRDDAKPMWHKAEYSELHTRAEFCGNCHNVFHPTNHFPIENTYNEWKFSVYAQKGIVCQDCHMMPVEKAIEVARTLEKPKNPGKASPMGPERPNVFTHEFVGANFTVTRLLGADRHADMAVQRLQSAAEVTLGLPETAQGGDVGRIKVRVTNVGAGHHLPTSLTEVREMWLDVAVRDASGRELYRSGALDDAHNLTEGTVRFYTPAVDEKGQYTVKPWEVTRFNYNSTIPPKGYAEREFAFLVPKEAPGPLQVQATLRYRSFPQAVANLLLGEKAPVLPIVDMAAASGSVPVR